MGTIQIKEKNEKNTEIIETYIPNTKKEIQKGLCEDKSKREKNAKHYRKRNGTYEAHYFNEPVHYFDEHEKKFKSIDNRLCQCKICLENGQEFNGFENKANEIKARFNQKLSDEPIFSLKKGKYEISWKYMHKNKDTKLINECYAEKKLKTEDDSKLEDEIIYREIERGIDLQYQLTSQKVKENIIVREKKDQYEFSFELKLINLSLALGEDKKELHLCANDDVLNKRLFTIPSPFMYDSSEEISHNVEYDIEELKKGTYQFTIRADEQWINEENRVFPVVIDPIIVYDDAPSIEIVSITSKENYFYTPTYGDSANVIGSSHQMGHARTYIQFNNINITGKIIAANLNLFQLEHVSGADLYNKNIEVRKVTSNWNPKTLNWGAKPSMSEESYDKIQFDPTFTNRQHELEDYPTKKPLVIDLTKLLNENDQKGIVLKNIDEPGNVTEEDYISIASPYVLKNFVPQLIVYYLQDENIVSNKQHQTSVGRAGTGVLDLYLRRLHFTHEDVTIKSGKMPLSINHIFNSRFRGETSIKTSGKKETDKLGCGKGWKLNYHQFVLPYANQVSLEGDQPIPVYSYIEANGNEIILVKRRVNLNQTEIGDEIGMGLVYDEMTRVLTDKQNNQLIFDLKGRLIEIKNSNQISTYIQYENDLVSRIEDGGGHIASFFYLTLQNQTKQLSRISLNDQMLDFEYNDANFLTKIKYMDADNSISQYFYGESGNINDLTSVRDCTGYKIQYTHSANKITISESTNIESIGHKEVYDGVELVRDKTEIEYSKNKTIIYHNYGRETVHRFNDMGFSYCSFDSKRNANELNTIKNSSYNGGKNKEQFSAQISYTKKNYVKNGSMEVENSDWVFEGNAIIGDGRSGDTCIEGQSSYKLRGGIGRKKKLYQYVTVPANSQSFLLQAFAKGKSIPLKGETKFQLLGQIIYSDGTSEEQRFSEFNWQETDWQLVMVGLCKSQVNLNKTIRHILVELEYSYNSGDVYFDSVKLVKGNYSKQIVKPQYYFNKYQSDNRIEAVTSIQFVTRSTLNSGGITISTLQDGKQLLTIEDITRMMTQKPKDHYGLVILNGQVISGQALIGDYWGNSLATIFLKTPTKEWNLSEIKIICENTLEMEDGSSFINETLLNHKNQVKKSTITDEFNREFSHNYTYENDRLISQNDNYRHQEIPKKYDVFGNQIYEARLHSVSGNPNNKIVDEVEFDQTGNYLNRVFDERGGQLCTTLHTNTETGLLEYILQPNELKTEYTYNETENIQSISSRIESDVIQNTMDYTHGLLTEVKNYTNTVHYEYDGFGRVVNTLLNGESIKKSAFKDNSDYTSENEETFNYDEIIFQNKNNSNYGVKNIYNQEGTLRCKIGTYYDDYGGAVASEEITRAEYNSDQQLYKILDKALGESKELTYTYEYLDDGTSNKMIIEGFYTGEIEILTDHSERLVGKSVTFNEKKDYLFNYQKIGESTFIDNRISSVVLPEGTEVGYSYDLLNRFKSRNLDTGYGNRNISESYNYLPGYSNYETSKNDRTTNYVDGILYEGNNFTELELYSYDYIGNIESIQGDENVRRFKYDPLSRLIREDNETLNFSKTFEYDSNGNIQAIIQYPYSLDEYLSGSIRETMLTYSLGTHKDQIEVMRSLDTENQNQIYYYENNQYDGVGNPCNYKGNELEWNRGKNLSRYGELQFFYNSENVRQEKVLPNGEVHRYYVEGTTIHKEERESLVLWYYYDQTGITAMELDGEPYYFQKNMQKDVVRIFNRDGDLVVRYIYDAWGNQKVLNPDGTENNDEYFIGNINPFRYRSYYYDRETGLYYLNSRYYDPELGRFINADDVSYLDPESINGLNLYSYCGNNPAIHIKRGSYSGISINNYSAFSVANSGGVNGSTSGNGNIGSGVTQVDASGLGVLGQIIGGVQIAAQLIGQGFGKLSSSLAMQAAGLADDLIFMGGGIFARASNKLGEAYTALANTNAAWGDIFGTASTIAKGIGIGLFALDIGLSAYNNFSNSSLSLGQKIGFTAMDWGVSIGTFALAMMPNPIFALIGLGVWAAYEFWLKDVIRGWFS